MPETQITHSRGGRLSLSPVDINTLEQGPCCYLSTVTWSSHQGSVNGFRREKLQRLATFHQFHSLSVQMPVAARSRMESRTIVCYLGGAERRLEPLERIYGRIPSVDPSGRFAGVPNLGKPYIERKPVTLQPIIKTAINWPMDHIGEM